MKSYRPLFRREVSQYRDHLLRLDEDSRTARFAAHVSESTIQRYCTSIDWHCTKVIGYFQDALLRGAAEIRYDSAPSPTNAELAFSVERQFQNSRIGSNLMSRALIFLRNQGITKVHVVCLLSNRRMRTMATRYRSEVAISYGDVYITIDAISDYTPKAIEELADHMADILC
jgi:GNAT superfamily N-acetyltransferase